MTRCRKYLYIFFVIVLTAIFFGCNGNYELSLQNTPPTQSFNEPTAEIPESTSGEALPANTQVFALDGITLTLPDDFEEVSDQQWPLFYNGYIIVKVVREPFTVHPSLEDMSLGEYGPALIESKDLDATVRVQSGLHWFDYKVSVPDSEQEIYHFDVIYKTSTDFWIIEFSCDSRAAVRYRPFFAQWAKMIQFEA